MNGVALLIALSSLGVDYNVQQSEDGKLEYVIQIEPEFLRSLADGQQIHSDVPPDAGAIERVLVRVGTTAAKHSQTHLTEYRRLLISSSRFASSEPGRAAPDGAASIVWPAKSKPELSYNVAYGYQPDTAGVLSYYVQMNSTLLQSLQVGDEVRAAIDPAAGRVERFVILSGSDELPKIPVEPVAATTPVAGATGGASGRRSITDRAGGFGAGTRPPASAPPSFGPAAAPPAQRPLTPLAHTPDYHGGAGVAPEQPQYPVRGGLNYGGQTYGGVGDPTPDYRDQSPATVPPAYTQPPAAYGDDRFDRLRGGAEQPPVQYGPPPGYVARTAAEQPQLPPRAGGYTQPPAANYAPQPAVDDRFASVPRNPAAAGGPLPAPQLNPTSTTKNAAEPAAANKPYVPLLFTAFALFLSIGGNLYLGWTAAEFYSRYRLATERLRSAGR